MDTKRTVTVSEYLNYFLVNQGVKYVFGFQGSAMLKMVYDMERNGDIKYIQTFHEQSAAFAADAYARITNTPSVAIATSGPGAINMLAGVADAFFDSVPCIFITGQSDLKSVLSRGEARQNGFQDMDIVSVAMPITKSSRMLTCADNIAYELEYAWYLCQNGRKGPVLLDIPLDLQFAEIDPDKLIHFIPPVKEDKQYDVMVLQDLLGKANRPLILAGGGVRQSGAISLLKEFAEKIDVKIVTTMMGIDLDGDFLGFGGLYGYTHVNIAIKEADLLIVCGARMGTRHAAKKSVDYTNAVVLHIDVDPSELRRFVKDEYCVEGDLKNILEQWNSSLVRNYDYHEWNEHIEKLKSKYSSRIYINEVCDPLRITKCILDIAPEDCIVTADVGQNQVWVAQAFQPNSRRRLLNSGGYGSMGFSLPAAIGSSYVGDKMVLAFMGDGGFHMNQQELLFLQLHKNNVKCIVFNNGCLGLMKETQDRYYKGLHVGNTDHDFACVDLRRLSEVYGIQYFLVRSERDVEMLRDEFRRGGPCLIEIIVPYDSQVINRYDEFENLGIK